MPNFTTGDGLQKVLIVDLPEGLAQDDTLSTRLPEALDADGGMKVHVQNPSSAGGGGLTDGELRATAVPMSLASVPTHAVTGPLTDSQLRASAVPVSATFFQATQPVSLASVPSHAVTGPLTDTQLRATAVPVSGTFFLATQPVSGTVTATGPLTDTQLRATAVPVSGTFFQATQPVSGPLTDTQLRAAAVPVSLGVAAAASSTPVGSVSLGNSLGKTLAMKTGSLVTTLATADQVILTYTVTAGKTLYLQYLLVSARLTVFATAATFFGAVSLESPSGTKLLTVDLGGPGIITNPELEFTEPLPIAAGTVIRVVCTPSAVTSMTWKASFGGYEK